MQLAHGVHALNLQHCGNSGTQGCKNIRSGGDTAGADFDGKGPFFTYVVFRSFKHPPPCNRSI